MAYAAMAYNHMSHLLQQQQLQQDVKIEEELKEESVEIPSDLSISFYSSPESSLNISLHSSSAEEDENGVLTFKLSSDDDESAVKLQKTNEKCKNDCLIKDFEDEGSTHSYISLESKDSEKPVIKEATDIYELSSSDSDEIEIVDTALSNISN
ncbi:hypothetical protein EVAR_71092_1 [Eumeta japonica]|uniref:Uncharacterized protein n=1 Tax=Eumeta variegata TaxID=151549 RepID=A0A4C1SR99_EUMVA|nr:hypothetical protein EVAR_71092_1 [Eumeta japonica]